MLVPLKLLVEHKQQTKIDRCAVDFRLLFIFDTPNPV